MAHYNPRSVELTDEQLKKLTAARLLSLYKAVRAVVSAEKFNDDSMTIELSNPKAEVYRDRIKAVLDTKPNVSKINFRKPNQKNGHKQKMVTSKFSR